MSYILTQSATNSPFSVVRVSGTSVDHPDTISDSPWLSYDASTDTISVTDTDAYFETGMSLNRTSAAGVVTYSLDPNGASDTHTWAQVNVAGNTPGLSGSFSRGDDTAYSVHNTTRVDYEYRPSSTSYSYITERSKTIVKRL